MASPIGIGRDRFEFTGRLETPLFFADGTSLLFALGKPAGRWLSRAPRLIAGIEGDRAIQIEVAQRQHLGVQVEQGELDGLVGGTRVEGPYLSPSKLAPLHGFVQERQTFVVGQTDKVVVRHCSIPVC